MSQTDIDEQNERRRSRAMPEPDEDATAVKDDDVIFIQQTDADVESGSVSGVFAFNGLFDHGQGVEFPQRNSYILDDVSVVWRGFDWAIIPEGFDPLYTSSDDVAEPWDVTTWAQDSGGELPLPVVTESPVSKRATKELFFSEPVKTYRAILDVSSAADPTVTVLEDGFDDPVVWTRTDVGRFTGTSADIVDGKTFAIIGVTTQQPVSGSDVNSLHIVSGAVTVRALKINAAGSTSAYQDALTKVPVEIIIYP